MKKREGDKKNLEEAICLADSMIEVIKIFSKDEVGCFYKYEAFYYTIKAYLYACTGNGSKMRQSIAEGKVLADSFEKTVL